LKLSASILFGILTEIKLRYITQLFWLFHRTTVDLRHTPALTSL